jgi:hypothetical protein
VYNNFINQKRVIFVGGASILQGKNQGKFIDSFDVVVKTNGSLLLESPEYYRDYGKRIDVLYTNNQFQRECYPELLANVSKIKYLRMKCANNKRLRELRKKIPTEIITPAIDKVNKIPVQSALMGCYIIQDILDNNPSELYLTGIDFFVSKKPVFEHDNYREYIPGYLPERIRKQGNEINKGKTKDSHDQYSNTKYIYDLYLQNKLNMPDFIKELMIKVIKNKGYHEWK